MADHLGFARSTHGDELKVRLKLAIKELRTEVVREMAAKLKRDARDVQGQSAQRAAKERRRKLRKRLMRIHPLLGRVEELMADPLCLLGVGFAVFVVFTLLLFVV